MMKKKTDRRPKEETLSYFAAFERMLNCVVEEKSHLQQRTEENFRMQAKSVGCRYSTADR